MIISELFWSFFFGLLIDLPDESNGFVVVCDVLKTRQRRLAVQSSSGLDTPPTLQFNLTSLLQADNAKKIHIQQLYEDVLSIIMKPSQSTTAELKELDQSSDILPTSRPAMDPFRRFLQPYSSQGDLKHHGHFAVPPSSSIQERMMTLPPNVAFAMDDLLYFLPSHLSPIASSATATPPGQESETVVMLSNLHQSLPASWQQVEYISKVLTVEGQAPSISLLHVGTNCSQQNADDASIQMKLTHDSLEALKSLQLISSHKEEPLTGENGEVLVRRRDIDLLQAISCGSTNNDDLVVETLVKLVDLAIDTSQSRLVLICSSIQSFYVVEAIEQWKEVATSSNRRLRHSGLTEKEANDLLNERLTVVTMGSLSKFPVGPAYIHVSMYDDTLANTISLPAKTEQRNQGDAKSNSPNNPVVLQAVSPYPSAAIEDQNWPTDALYSSDAHNMMVCAIQFLHLVLRINGLFSFREVFKQGSQPTPVLDISQSQFNINYAGSAKGLLALPQDEIFLAVLQAMGVGQWLWNPQDEYDEDIIEEVLPHFDYAKATVEEYFGYDVYEELQNTVEASSA